MFEGNRSSPDDDTLTAMYTRCAWGLLHPICLRGLCMFENAKLGTKLIGGFFFVALISVLIGTFSLVNMRAITHYDDALYEDATSQSPLLTRIAVSFQGMRIASRDFINAQGDPS